LFRSLPIDEVKPFQDKYKPKRHNAVYSEKLQLAFKEYKNEQKIESSESSTEDEKELVKKK
jgi:hypothetical protein